MKTFMSTQQTVLPQCISVLKMQTNQALGACSTAINDMYPGFKRQRKFMAVDEIDQYSLADTTKMEAGNIGIAERTANILRDSEYALAQVTATPYGPKVINATKYEQIGLEALVPKRMWWQELAAGHKYAGENHYFGPRRELANNIIPSAECPSYAIPVQV